MFRFDRKQFFSSYRTAFGPLQQLQVDGLNFLLEKIESDPYWNRVEEIAYVLATVKHETGITRNSVLQTYQPIRELRAKIGTKLRKSQDRYWRTNTYGRGYVQLTWPENYKKFGLLDNPDKALEPETAYRILAEGMRRGSFTGKKLSDFINNSEVDYYNARTVVNGHDKADLIAGYAVKFERILKASLSTESRPASSELVEDLKQDPPVEEVKTEHPPAAAVQSTIPAIPPLVAHVPNWAKKIVGWGAGINIAGIGSSFAFFRDNPHALGAALNILKWMILGLGGVALIIVAGVFIAKLYYAKLANDLNRERLRNFADQDTNNVDFSGWKGQADGEIKT